MPFRLGCAFICLLHFLRLSYIVADSFFPEQSYSRAPPSHLLSTRWRNLFRNDKAYDDSLLNPTLKSDDLLASNFKYPVFPEIFNDTKLFSNIFLNERPIQENIDLFDALVKREKDNRTAKNKNITEKEERDVKQEGKNDRENNDETESENAGTKKYEEKVTEKKTDSENNGKTEMGDVVTTEYEEIVMKGRGESDQNDGDGAEMEDISTVKLREKESGKREVEEKEIKTTFENTSSDRQNVKDKENSNDEIKEVNVKHEVSSEKTGLEDNVDDAENTSNVAKTEEVTRSKTDPGEVIEHKETNGSDKNSQVSDTETENEMKNESENGKINPKTEIEDKEENVENKKQIMSVENNEEQSKSKKGKTSEEETSHKIEKETDKEKIPETELNEIKNEDTKQNDELLKVAQRENENNRNRNGSDVPRLETESEESGMVDVNRTKERKPKVQETLRETSPDELSNSDLDVLQDNSTNFICLTDSSKCLSKSSSILLTTGILIGIIVGLVTIVGITTGLSVYIFHRWKLRKKSPKKSRASKMERRYAFTLNKPIKKRSTKPKSNQIETMEENDSPVNTLEAITVHNYREDRRHTYNL